MIRWSLGWLLASALTLASWAAPRVGLLHVEGGKVWLDGRPVAAPALLEQGGKLVLEKGARARLRLLGGNTEIALIGPRSLTIDRPALEKLGRALPRGQVALVPDIGNVARGATNTTRAQRKRRGFVVETPPQASPDGWIFPVRTAPPFSDREPPQEAEWTLSRLAPKADSPEAQGGPGPTFRAESLAYGQCGPDGQGFRLPADTLRPGQRYLLSIRTGSDPLDAGYWQSFRILTPEEKAMLSEVEAAAQLQSREEDSVQPLLNLAALYLEWDQLAEADRVLNQAAGHARWSSLDSGTARIVETTRATLDAIWDRSLR